VTHTVEFDILSLAVGMADFCQ